MSFQIEFSFSDCSDVISKITSVIDKMEEEKDCLSSALSLLESRLGKCIENLSDSQDRLAFMNNELSVKLSGLEEEINRLKFEKNSISTGEPSKILEVSKKLDDLNERKEQINLQLSSFSRDKDKLLKKKQEIEQDLKDVKEKVRGQIKKLCIKQDDLKVLCYIAKNAKKIMNQAFLSSVEGMVYINPKSLLSFSSFLSSYKEELGKGLSSLQNSCLQMNQTLQDNVSSASVEIMDKLTRKMGALGYDLGSFAKELNNTYDCCLRYLKLNSSF